MTTRTIDWNSKNATRDATPESIVSALTAVRRGGQRKWGAPMKTCMGVFVGLLAAAVSSNCCAAQGLANSLNKVYEDETHCLVGPEIRGEKDYRPFTDRNSLTFSRSSCGKLLSR
jgi:hypothetical protein